MSSDDRFFLHMLDLSDESDRAASDDLVPHLSEDGTPTLSRGEAMLWKGPGTPGVCNRPKKPARYTQVWQLTRPADVFLTNRRVIFVDHTMSIPSTLGERLLLRASQAVGKSRLVVAGQIRFEWVVTLIINFPKATFRKPPAEVIFGTDATEQRPEVHFLVDPSLALQVAETARDALTQFKLKVQKNPEPSDKRRAEMERYVTAPLTSQLERGDRGNPYHVFVFFNYARPPWVER